MRRGALSFVSVAVLFLDAAIGAGACSAPAEDAIAADGLAIDGEVTLDDVQRAIQAFGAKWTAGPNDLSRLSPSDRKMRLGLSRSEVPDGRITILHDAVPQRGQLPAAHDWRDVDGANYVSPMLDQGRCGSCVAFATVGTFETQLNIAAHDTSSPWQLSPQYLFACGGGECGFGWMPEPAARFIVNKGVPDQACMPYTSGPHGDDARCSAACAGASARTIKARAYGTPSGGGMSVAAVKRALLDGPLVATMTVYDDFMYYTGGVYKHVTGGVAGGHAVSIVGYSDADQAWIVRNSWGTGWGENGFFRIAWDDDSGVGQETWNFDAATPGPYVEIVGVRDGALLSGETALTFDVQALAGAPISWTLSNATAEVAQGVSPTGATAVLDTTTVPDGVYTLQAHGGEGASRISGPPHIVYILNGTETGSLRFTNLTEGQTLRGNATWDLAVTARPVPATHVDWTITNASGEVVVHRSSENTGPLMQLGWSTKRWPNGPYTVAVTGAAGTQSLAGTSVKVTVRN